LLKSSLFLKYFRIIKLLIKDSLLKNWTLTQPDVAFSYWTAYTNAFPHHNERRVLQVNRRLGEASKADVARQTNLTKTAVGTIVSTNYKAF